MAETVCARQAAVVVCTGGIHMEHITGKQIEEIEKAIEGIADEIGDSR